MHFHISLIRLIIILFSYSISSNQALAFEADYPSYSSQLSSDIVLGLGYIDNFLFSGENKENTQVISIKPEIGFKSTWDKTLVTIEGKANVSRFSEFEEDDNTSYSLAGEVAHYFTYQQKLSLKLNYGEQYEYRGTGTSLGLGEMLDSGNERLRSNYLINYRFGQDHSIARINLFVGQSYQEYTTRRQFTDIYDLASNHLSGKFDFFVGNHLYASAELSYQADDYENNEMLNGEHYQLLIGSKWQASEASIFEALIGQQQIHFDNKLLNSSEDFSWRILFNWRPYDFFSIKLDSQSAYEASYQGSDQYLVVDHINAHLEYDVNSRWSLATTLGLNRKEIRGPSYRRSDDFGKFILASGYHFSETLSFKAKYLFNDLTSSLQGLDYQRNELTIQVKVLI
ncbi:outer membrane beta-barrel protein [Thalassotalea sp. PLHSN55]|uniref:outer membrane beta-barrel protein n=1 Tax=Thalassotalea sp. PLHSN55 TaxID=3435888 RepID=UPI003F86042B